MRRIARVDGNHQEIVEGLRGVGASVQSLATIGKGCPDILVGFRGVNYVMEIKDGNKPPSARKLTPDEKKWHFDWRGEVHVVESLQEALWTIGVVKERESYGNINDN